MKKITFSKNTVKRFCVFLREPGLILLFAAIFVLLIRIIPEKTEYRYTVAESSHPDKDNIPTEKSTLSKLVLENGNLVIYGADGDKPDYFDASLYSLTDYDTAVLSEGIYASAEELYALIESLSS